MKFGSLLSGTITHLDEKGRGVFTYTLPIKADGTRSVIVPFTFPGDVIDATFVRRDKGHWVADLVRVHEPSPDRQAAPCPHAGTCGGCLWQHLSYEAQLKLKTEAIAKAYRTAHIELAPKTIIPSPTPLGYRNRMDYVVGWQNTIGLKVYGRWNAYLDLQTCLLLDEVTPTILQVARDVMNELNWQPWDAYKHVGQFRYVIIRLGRNTQQRHIHLLVSDLSVVSDAERAHLVEKFSSFCTSLVLGENTKPTDVSYAERCEVLKGTLHLEEEVNGTRYQIHPNAFFQTNTVMAKELQDRVLTALGPLEGRHILDLYGGIGFFGIACAKKGATVFGQELDPFAVSEAKVNAEKNNVSDRFRFASGPVEQLEDGAWKSAAAIIDPPRAGLHPKALESLCKYGPDRVVYVSCNYHSFLKEWPIISASYELESIEPLDLFPQTPHVEVIHTLKRRALSSKSC